MLLEGGKCCGSASAREASADTGIPASLHSRDPRAHGGQGEQHGHLPPGHLHHREARELLRKAQVPLRHTRLFSVSSLRRKWSLGGAQAETSEYPVPYCSRTSKGTGGDIVTLPMWVLLMPSLPSPLIDKKTKAQRG